MRARDNCGFAKGGVCTVVAILGKGLCFGLLAASCLPYQAGAAEVAVQLPESGRPLSAVSAAAQAFAASPSGTGSRAVAAHRPGRAKFELEPVSRDATAVSMHPVITTKPAERRAQRLATATPLDNRISYGCINVPAKFFENVVRPAFTGTDGIVYVLPETKSARAVFASYDVDEEHARLQAASRTVPAPAAAAAGRL